MTREEKHLRFCNLLPVYDPAWPDALTDKWFDFFSRLMDGPREDPNRAAAAFCYQFVAAIPGVPVEILDNLSALSRGYAPPHEWPYPASLPITPEPSGPATAGEPK